VTNVERFTSDPRRLDEGSLQYKKDIQEKNGDPGFTLQENTRWISEYLSYPDCNSENDEYMAFAASGFWVRRAIDGTEPQIFRIVIKVLSIFEPSALTKP
jgi:hypothetical protein